ncbi:MAG: signal peptidase I [Acidobacteria bacterium]|nr:signal peptidase I [Acidobacteriota bacterium]MCI0621036.1 signal peptidase I [Acidobacteriota bacterium]MCI0721796.1 signal peptidase I [Acidobacteriota bacterium]
MFFGKKREEPLTISSGESIHEITQPQPAEETQAARKSAAREWLESLVFSLIFVFFFTNFIAQATQVPTESMKPTILVGDHFFLDKFAFPANYPQFVSKVLPAREIDRGDIVAFKSPGDPKVPFIKRVIGLPGETLEIRDKTVYINGKELEESYKHFIDPNVYERGSGIPSDYIVRDNFGPKVIPPNSYFMMGDNRDNSNDSRYWGVVDGKSVIGKPLFIYWSYDAPPYDPRSKSVLEHAQDYLSVAINFFSKTRWGRTGKVLR